MLGRDEHGAQGRGLCSPGQQLWALCTPPLSSNQPPACHPTPTPPPDEGGEVDQRRLRLYERSKLRYYYAIITCDSAGARAEESTVPRRFLRMLLGWLLGAPGAAVLLVPHIYWPTRLLARPAPQPPPTGCTRSATAWSS